MSKKIILSMTGIRSEYDIMSTVYSEIKKSSNLDLRLIITGAHLSESFGNTINEIKKDGFKIEERIENLLNYNSSSSRIKGLGIQIQSLVQTITRIKPDILLVLGDREEAMAIALAGAYMNIPIAHVCGGDRVVGNVDDQIRHAVTKLAHIHFVTNDESMKRVLKLGEQKFRVFNVGNPGIDRLVKVPKISMSEISNFLEFNINYKNPYIVFIQHPLSSEAKDSKKQIYTSLRALKELGIQTIMTYPNSDYGSLEIINELKKFKDLAFLKVTKNLPRNIFINLLKNCSCLVGNSSAGILESPFLKIPVVNIGNRQKGRLNAGNVIFVKHKKDEIKKAIIKSIFNKKYKQKIKNIKNPYGNGTSSKKIVKILDKLTINDTLLIKDITY